MVNSVGGFSITSENPICPNLSTVNGLLYALILAMNPDYALIGQDPGILMAVLLISLCLSTLT